MLCKQIDSQNTLIKRKAFPSLQRSGYGHHVLLGIGGNIGDVIRRFEHLLIYFARSPWVHVVEVAPILKNPPFGYLEQEDFYNSIIRIKTRLSPKALLEYVLHIEKIFGRQRVFKDGPRTLDIDILFYEGVLLNTDRLRLPHPGWSERPSVLIPLGFLEKMDRNKKHKKLYRLDKMGLKLSSRKKD